jgi:integrase
VLDLVRSLEGKAESTRANDLKPLRGLLEYAVFRGYVAVNPVSQVPKGWLPSCNSTREHREWTTEEVEALIVSARRLDKRPEARTDYADAIETLVRTGLRLGEMLGLRYGDIDFSGNVLSVRRQWTKDGRVAVPKTAKAVRRVMLSPQLSAKLAARKLRLGAGDEDFVFASKKGGNPPLHSNFRRRGWEPAVEAAGLTDGPKVTPHDARHAFASQMSDLGLTSSDVAEVLGHTTAGVTERIYTHAFNREEREERIRQAMTQAAGGASS